MSEDGNEEVLQEETSFIKDDDNNEKSEDTVDVQFDDIFKTLGDIGFYQLLVFVMSNLLELSGTLSVIYFVFECADPGWKCENVECKTSCVNLTAPNLTNGFCSNDDFICVNRTFNPTYTSVLTQWNLVCDEFWKTKVIQTAFFIGLLPGTILGGQVCDSFGRRPTILIMWTLMAVTQVTLRFSTNYIVYTVIRFITGCVSGAIVCVAPVLSVEFLSPKWRILAAWRISWQSCPMIIALLAYLCRDWQTLTTAVGLLTFPLLPAYIFVYPESPRWLIQMGRLKEAEKWIRTAYMFNRIKPPRNLIRFIKNVKRNEEASQTKRGTYLDLFYNREYTKWTVILALCSFGMGLAWYGVNGSISSLMGDIYLNVAFAGSASSIVGIVAIYTNNCIGRVKGYLMYALLMGCCFTLILVLKSIGKADEYGTVVTWSALLSLALRSGCRSAMYTSCFELYPTIMRNISSAMLGISMKIAAVVSPQIVLLGSIHAAIPYILYALFVLSSGVLTYLFIPETKGKPLPDSLPTKESDVELRI